MTPWIELEVQYALFRWLELRGRTMVLANFQPYHWHECDLFSMTQAMYFHEIEIKTSRSDFRADFKKYGKHEVLAGGRDRWGYGELPPRTFCYACPEGLLSVDDMPEYAGLVSVERDEQSWRGYRVTVKKKPPVLANARKVTPEQVMKISANLWYRYANTWNEMACAKLGITGF